MADNFTAIQNFELPDPLYSFKWRAVQIPLGLPNTYLHSIDLGFLNLQAKSPTFKGGTYTQSAGFHQPAESVSCEFYEDDEATTLRWIHSWKQLVKDFRSGVYSIPKDYKKQMVINLLNNKNEVVLEARILGMWPSETNPLSLNYEGSERIKISQAFSSDGVELEFKKSGRLENPEALVLV